MLEFIISNYLVFIIVAIILLLGLLGYMMDKKKYEQYRQEIVNEERTISTLEAAPDVSNIASPVPTMNEIEQQSEDTYNN